MVSGHNLAVGGVSIRHNTAVATITGTICTTASFVSIAAARAAGHPAQCVTNINSHPSNPAFRVRLLRQKRWYVTFGQ
jgi:hypothetical protein